MCVEQQLAVIVTGEGKWMMKVITLFPLDQLLKPIPDLRYPEVIHL